MGAPPGRSRGKRGPRSAEGESASHFAPADRAKPYNGK